jgi:hypothetical protein
LKPFSPADYQLNVQPIRSLNAWSLWSGACEIATMGQMDINAVEAVGPERAAPAPFVPLRSKHEVIDSELATASEQLGEALLTVRAVEDVLFLDPLERQQSREFVAESVVFFFLDQQGFARRDPFLMRDDCVRQVHWISSFTVDSAALSVCPAVREVTPIRS